MRRYAVVLFSPSALTVGADAYTAGNDETAVRVEDAAPVAGAASRPGLVFTVLLTEASAAAAMRRAEGVASTVADILSAAHAAPVGDITPWIAIDLAHDEPDRDFAQWIGDLSLPSLQRRLDAGRAGVLVDALNALQVDSDRRRRLERALHYIRRGDGERDALARFSAYWHGLETVNELLRDQHGLAKKPPATATSAGPPVAGAAPPPIAGPYAGARYAVERLAGRANYHDWHALKKFRNRLAHGDGELGDLFAAAPAHATLARRALVGAVLDLFGITAGDAAAWQRNPLALPRGAESLVEATLEGIPASVVEQGGQLPHFTFAAAPGDILPSEEPGGAPRQAVTLTVRAHHVPGRYRVSGDVRWAGDPEDPDAVVRILDVSRFDGRPDTPGYASGAEVSDDEGEGAGRDAAGAAALHGGVQGGGGA